MEISNKNKIKNCYLAKHLQISILFNRKNSMHFGVEKVKLKSTIIFSEILSFEEDASSNIFKMENTN